MRKALEDVKIDTRLTLAGLWAALMLLYIYCDIFSLFRPGHIGEIMAGHMGPFAVSQATLVAFGIMMILPVLMLIACLFLKAVLVRRLNIIGGALYTAVGIGNMAGETWAYYILYGVVEVLVTLLIFFTAIGWGKKTVKEEVKA